MGELEAAEALRDIYVLCRGPKFTDGEGVSPADVLEEVRRALARERAFRHGGVADGGRGCRGDQGEGA